LTRTAILTMPGTAEDSNKDLRGVKVYRTKVHKKPSMKRRIVFVILLVVLGIAALGAAGEPDDVDAVIVFRISEDLEAFVRSRGMLAFGLRPHRMVLRGTLSDLLPVAFVRIPREYVKVLERNSRVLAVQEEVVYTLESLGAPSAVPAIPSLLASTYTGRRVKIAVIDTGVNYDHPGIGGFGRRVVGGYDFVDNDADPMEGDEWAHGTGVVGMILGGKDFLGTAPEALILAYRVVDPDRRALTSNIIKAIEMAVKEGAHVINLSMGTEEYDRALDIAIRKAVERGVVVVAAAGNAGPRSGTIRFPASHPYVIGVGAAVTGPRALKAWVRVLGAGIEVEAFPMNGTVLTDGVLRGTLVYVGLAGKDDVEELDLRGKIALSLRGRYYFSDKADNVADRGAAALIVYNNVSEPFLGGLIRGTRIPVVSISGSEGWKILLAMKRGHVDCELFVGRMELGEVGVALFSSRGPFSSFYLKPNLIAPGAYVRTFSLRDYAERHGTSFAASYVSGVAALLVEKHGRIAPFEIMGILMSTADVLLFGATPYNITAQGAGVVNITRALESELSVARGWGVLHVSRDPRSHDERRIVLGAVRGKELHELRIEGFHGFERVNVTAELHAGLLRVRASGGANVGVHGGWLLVSAKGVRCVIPAAVFVSPIWLRVVSVNASAIVLEAVSDVPIRRAMLRIATFESADVREKEVEGPLIVYRIVAGGEYWFELDAGGGAKGYAIVAVDRPLEEDERRAALDRLIATALFCALVVLIVMATFSLVTRFRGKRREELPEGFPGLSYVKPLGTSGR